ncbi:MAG: glycosyltransferase [Spirulinaceae cyanobacterium RM2_2_10]|nr:glycosyltransferase [Spirulinaceae cyanobacterium SM2_1_0]NJO19933.1 glycosyltransferase [Spirulinaceae cyanobacterium RM2_2_10]
MRILQIVPSISLVYGGPSQMVQSLSAALAAQAVEVTILTTDANGDAGQPPLDVPLVEPVLTDGYQVRYFRCAPFRRYKFSLGLLRWLAQHGREYDLAHIHALFSPVSTAAATVARWIGLPYILRPLGTLDPADLQKKRQLKQLYGRWLEGPNLAGAAGIHFTSQQEAVISERFGAKTRDIIVPLGVNLPAPLPEPGQARQQWGIAPHVPLVLFMSRLDPKKGFDLLFPALDQLAAEGVDFHFVLAGSNPQDATYERQIQQQVEQASWRSQATVTGFVGGQAKLALLRDADLFVLPSYYENFGIAVAEAMLATTSVVVSNQVHIWDTIAAAEAGWIVACDPQQRGAIAAREELVNQLRVALQQPDERKRRGQNAHQLAQTQYSWSAIAQQLKQVYAQH